MQQDDAIKLLDNNLLLFYKLEKCIKLSITNFDKQLDINEFYYIRQGIDYLLKTNNTRCSFIITNKYDKANSPFEFFLDFLEEIFKLKKYVATIQIDYIPNACSGFLEDLIIPPLPIDIRRRLFTINFNPNNQLLQTFNSYFENLSNYNKFTFKNIFSDYYKTAFDEIICIIRMYGYIDYRKIYTSHHKPIFVSTITSNKDLILEKGNNGSLYDILFQSIPPRKNIIQILTHTKLDNNYNLSILWVNKFKYLLFQPTDTFISDYQKQIFSKIYNE